MSLFGPAVPTERAYILHIHPYRQNKCIYKELRLRSKIYIKEEIILKEIEI